MYNYWLSEKSSHNQNKVEKIKKDEIDKAPNRREKQERLVHNYKKRVENFVMQMLEKPIKYGELRAPETHRFREEDPSKFKGGATILVKSFKTEKDRIRESIEKNKEFQTDHVEFASHEFRKRDPSREIQPQMHFSTKSGLDRIASKLGSMKAALDSDNKRFDRDDSFLLELSKSPVMATNKYIAKHFMAELHQKTHFNAATSLYLALPDGLVDNNLPSRRLKKKSEKGLAPIERRATKTVGGEDESPRSFKMNLPVKLKTIETKDTAKDYVAFEAPEIEENQKISDNNYGNNIENINPVEISKKILLDCHFIKSKPLSVRTLHPGDGHLSMLPLKSVREIYHDVYHKDIGSHRKEY